MNLAGVGGVRASLDDMIAYALGALGRGAGGDGGAHPAPASSW